MQAGKGVDKLQNKAVQSRIVKMEYNEHQPERVISCFAASENSFLNACNGQKLRIPFQSKVAVGRQDARHRGGG